MTSTSVCMLLLAASSLRHWASCGEALTGGLYCLRSSSASLVAPASGPKLTRLACARCGVLHPWASAPLNGPRPLEWPSAVLTGPRPLEWPSAVLTGPRPLEWPSAVLTGPRPLEWPSAVLTGPRPLEWPSAVLIGPRPPDSWASAPSGLPPARTQCSRMLLPSSSNGSGKPLKNSSLRRAKACLCTCCSRSTVTALMDWKYGPLA